MAFYDFFQRALSWHYLAGPGQALWTGIGSMLDDVVTATKVGVRARLPQLALPQALPEIARTFDLDYPVRWAEAVIRAYLTDPWTHYANDGSAPRMLAEIKALGYSTVYIFTYRNLKDIGFPSVFAGVNGQPDYSSFWYLVIAPPHPWKVARKWGAPGVKWGAAPFNWGGTASWAEIEEIRRVIRKWKPAASSCRFIEVWLAVDPMTGVPTNVVRWPVHEDWEQQGNGAYIEFYNTGFDKP